MKNYFISAGLLSVVLAAFLALHAATAAGTCTIQNFWTDPVDQKDYGTAARDVAKGETWTITGKFQGDGCVGLVGKIFLYKNSQWETPIAVGSPTNLKTNNTSIVAKFTFDEVTSYQVGASAYDPKSTDGKAAFSAPNLATLTVTADAKTPPAGNGNTTGAGNANSPGANANTTGAGAGGGTLSFDNPINAPNLPAFVIQVTRILLLLIGMIVVVVIIYGGFVLVTSQGNPEGIKKGRAIITWAIIGLVVALLAFSIVSILQNLIGK